MVDELREILVELINQVITQNKSVMLRKRNDDTVSTPFQFAKKKPSKRNIFMYGACLGGLPGASNKEVRVCKAGPKLEVHYKALAFPDL